jgi:hypothetical protein
MRYPPRTYSSLVYQRLADMRPRATQWLWPGWLALGKLALLEGDPGLGKSFLTLDLCARLSSGRDLPDGSPAVEPCNVIVLNAEDNVQDTVRPRLQAMDADLERIYFLEGVADEHGDDLLRFPRHALAIRELLAQTQAKLLVFDPLVAFLERRVAIHNDQCVRAALAILLALAEEKRCAILLVRHLNKTEKQRALYRGGGSIGFLAAVRCVWLAAADPKSPDFRVLIQLKNNLRALQPALAYQIADSAARGPSVAWLGPSALGLGQLLGPTKTRGRPRTESERAEENLRLFLEEAPRTRSEVLDFLQEQKISERTLRRAKQKLGIRSVWADTGRTRAIYWLLPGQVPPGVAADQLVALVTEKQESEALQAESQEWLRQLGSQVDSRQ